MVETFVIGAGGLLGSNVRAATNGTAPRVPIRWHTPALAGQDLRDLADHISARPTPSRVAWCAGAGFVGATADSLEDEHELFSTFLEHLAPSAVEAMFVASSAGGVYAANDGPALNEESPVAPKTPYGEWKLRQEATARAWAEAAQVTTVLGRIANLYGPGQNLMKMQGLTSHLVRAMLLRQPIPIFAPLDTRRDYIFGADAGRLISRLLDESAAASEPTVRTRIIASGRSVTIAELIGSLHTLRRQRVPAVFVRNAMTDLQPRSLTFASLYPDPLPRTPLAAGLGAVIREQQRLLGAGLLF